MILVTRQTFLMADAKTDFRPSISQKSAAAAPIACGTFVALAELYTPIPGSWMGVAGKVSNRPSLSQRGEFETSRSSQLPL